RHLQMPHAPRALGGMRLAERLWLPHGPDGLRPGLPPGKLLRPGGGPLGMHRRALHRRAGLHRPRVKGSPRGTGPDGASPPALPVPRRAAAEAPRAGGAGPLPAGGYHIEPPHAPDVGFVGTPDVGKPHPVPKGEALPSPPPTPSPTMAPRAAEPGREERAR